MKWRRTCNPASTSRQRPNGRPSRTATVVEPPNASAPLAYWEGVPAFPEPYCEEAGLDFMALIIYLFIYIYFITT